MSKKSPKATQAPKPTAHSPADDNTNAIAHAETVIATPMLRLIAIVYDGMLLLALLFLVSVVLVALGTYAFGTVGTASAQASELPQWYQNSVLTPSFVLTLVGFYGLFWRKSGQTLGMQTWRLKTISSDGRLLTWGQSFVRILCACVVPMVCMGVGYLLYGNRHAVMLSGLLGFLLNYLFCYVNRRGLAVQDVLSNTLTVRIPKHQHIGVFAGLRKKRT